MRRVAWILALATVSACWDGAEQDRSTREVHRFVHAADGAVRDDRTQLLWTARDSREELPWAAADARCRELSIGAAGWRLPTSEELAAIYDESEDQACGRDRCRVDPALDLSSPYQWSSTARGEEGDRRVYVDFRHGTRLAPLLRPTLTRRGLCVREAAVGAASAG
jgi:hypothetical protein